VIIRKKHKEPDDQLESPERVLLRYVFWVMYAIDADGHPRRSTHIQVDRITASAGIEIPLE
jgi:hypothetical protein